MLFISSHSKNSELIKREFVFAIHKEISDKGFLVIPVCLSKHKSINIAIDSQLRIESYGETSKKIFDKIMNFIKNGELTYETKNLSICYYIDGNNVLRIKSEMKILLPRIVLKLNNYDGLDKTVQIIEPFRYTREIMLITEDKNGKKIEIKTVVFTIHKFKFIGPKKKKVFS